MSGPIATICAEIAGSDRCAACGITAHGHAPVLALCRQLVDAGHDPATRLEAYRDTVLALRVRTIGEGAALTVEDDSRGTPRFRLWRGGAASPVRQTGVRATRVPLPSLRGTPVAAMKRHDEAAP
jgi:hypothetical protein